jgi:hypothetical protein
MLDQGIAEYAKVANTNAGHPQSHDNLKKQHNQNSRSAAFVWQAAI